jgi:hypothetical protein
MIDKGFRAARTTGASFPYGVRFLPQSAGIYEKHKFLQGMLWTYADRNAIGIKLGRITFPFRRGSFYANTCLGEPYN